MQKHLSPWKVLSVDSSKSASEVIKILLEKMNFLGRKLEVLKASSFDEAKTIIEGTQDISVILMEIMSETKTQGLNFIDDIRNKYANSKTRIIIRTGYPDALPDKQDIKNYEIDGYIPKELFSEAQIEITVMTAIRAYNQFKKTEQALSALAGSIAHESRNPLNAISLTAEHAEQRLSNQAAINPPVNIQKQTQTLSQDLQLIQEIAKTGSNVIDILLSNMRNRHIDRSGFKPLSISECCKKALERYAFKEGEKDKISLNIKDDFVFSGSDTLFHYLLFNLFKNALCCLPEKPETAINITIDSTATTRNLYFRDTGVGIPSDKIDQLFDDFTTSNKADGIGLGLAFCKRVMQSFDGSISCKSKLGQYTEFRLTFPVKEIALTQQDRKLKNKTHAVHDIDFGNQKILIIEDDVLARAKLKDLLGTVNLDLYFAVDGLDGLEQAQMLEPKLIFTDLNLPKLAGIALINQLHKLAYKPTIITVSGDHPDDDIKTKVDSVIIKPVSKSHLIEKLHQYLD